MNEPETLRELLEEIERQRKDSGIVAIALTDAEVIGELLFDIKRGIKGSEALAKFDAACLEILEEVQSYAPMKMGFTMEKTVYQIRKHMGLKPLRKHFQD